MDWHAIMMVLRQVLVGFHLVLGCRSAWRHALWRSWGRPALGRAWAWCSERKAWSATSDDVGKEMNHRTVKRGRVLCNWYGKFLCLLCAVSSFNHWMGWFRFLSPQQDLSFTISLALTIVGTACPGVINVRSIDLCFSLASFSMIIFGTSLRSPLSAMMTTLGSCLLRLLLVSFYAKVEFVLLWECIRYVAVCVAYWHQSATLAAEGCDGWVSVRAFATLELLMFFITMTFASTFNHALRADIVKEAQAAACRNQNSAWNILLSTVCEVVVELSADFQMTEHVPQITAFLMLGSSRSSQGLKLEQYMPDEEDRKLFMASLGTTTASASFSESVPLAGAMHVKLRDTMGNIIKVQLLHATFEGFDGALRHLIGIREFSDEPVANLRSRPGTLTATRPGASSRGSSSSQQRHHCGGHGGAGHGGGKARASGTPSLQATLASIGEPQAVLMGVAGSCGEESGQDAQSDASSKSSRSSRGFSRSQRVPICKQFRPTSEEARQVGLLGVLACWNVEAPPVHCCSFHETVQAASESLKKIKHRPCAQSFPWVMGGQCEACGILVGSAPEAAEAPPCNICGADGRKHAKDVVGL